MASSFIKDFVRYIPSKIIPGVIGILVIPILTRLFSPSDYGQYTIVVSTIAVLSIIATDWIAPSIVRYYAEYETKALLGTFYGTVFVMMSGSMVVMLVVSFAAIYAVKSMISPAIFQYLQIGLILFSVGVAFNVMIQLLIVRREIRAYTFYYVWRQCGCILIGICFVTLFQSGVAGLLWGSIIGMLAVGPFLFFRAFQGMKLNGYSSELRSNVMSYGFPLIATNIASWALTLSDRYVIEYFRGSHEVGLYSVSYNLADRTIMLVVSIIVLASGPIVMQIWEKHGEKETRDFLTNLTRYLLILLIPAAVGLSILAEPIVKVVATKEFSEGYKVIPMVAASIFLFGLQRNFQLALLFHKKTKVIMYIVVLSGVVNVLLNLIFVPRYGFVAAGYTTLASYFLFSVTTIVISRRYLVWDFPFGTLRNVLFSVSVMTVAVWLGMKIRLESGLLKIVIVTVLGSFVHVIIMVLTNEISRTKIHQLFAVKNS